MRILLVGVGYRGYTPLYAQALASLGHTVTTYVGLRQHDLKTRLHRLAAVRIPNAVGARRDYLWSEQARFHAWLRRTEPAVDLALFANADRLANDEILHDLASRRIPSAVWLLDDVGTLSTSRLDFRSFDFHATFSGAQRPVLEAQFGRPVHYVAQGFAPIVFHPRRQPWVSALVLGAPYPSRRAAVQTLEDAEFPVEVAGRAWSRHLSASGLVHLHGDVSLEDSVGMSSNARLCVNGHRDREAGVSPRVFEIAAAGGVLVDDNPRTPEFFEPGAEMLSWSEPSEITESAQRLRRDRSAAAAMGQRARRRVLAEHTIDKRFVQLLNGWGLPATAG